MDNDLNPLLSDFGLAFRGKVDYTRAGTPGYVAPEIWIEKKAHSNSADVYSFGKY